MYRRPAITVIQEFLGLVPALAAFNLPTVCVGPAYQLINDVQFGTYNGLQRTYAYASLMGGAQVDLEEIAEGEIFPATKKPIAMKLINADVEVMAESAVGSGVGDLFSDLTPDRFATVSVGNQVVIGVVEGIVIVAPQINGVSVSTPGQANRLSSGSPDQFADVKAGDLVVITDGDNTITGSFAVTIKINNSSLILDADINDGGGSADNIEYSIEGDRGQLNQGVYRIKSKTDANNVVLESPLVENESPITYFVKKAVASIDIDRSDITATLDDLTLPAGLKYNGLNIVSGTLRGSYRALRNDLASNIKEFVKTADLEVTFGSDQITPQNPLAFGLSIMLRNTATPVYGLGLNGNAIDDEQLAFQAAFDVLSLTEMYAIICLTQNPAIHQIIRSHVSAYSEPDMAKERIGVVNRKLISIQIEQEESTLTESLVNASIIVNTQIAGSGLLASPTKLTDADPDKFMNVGNGDSVVIVGGTNAILGTYTVSAKIDSNNLTLSGSIVSANSTDIQYYIVRKDGLAANGVTFYDRNANFISDGIAAGHSVRFLSGLTGSYRVTNVLSNKKLQIEQVPGILSLQSGMSYEIFRDLSKSEQASALAGYSSSLALRRIVNLWPDVLKTPVGQTTQDLPGFYGACAIGAMISGLPTQQGFTHLSISGFLGFEHSTGYFSDLQLDTIAEGGTMILSQDGEDQPLYIRHQLTTDRSSIKFQELSITKNVDFTAKFIRRTYAPFVGQYNIVTTTMDELRTTAKAILSFLKEDTKLPRIGGVIKSGTLASLMEHPTQIDSVVSRFAFDFPIPLNNMYITIEA